MTTMLDKCAVAGDITQGIDRRGVWTAAITVIGGTSGTAVKSVIFRSIIKEVVQK